MHRAQVSVSGAGRGARHVSSLCRALLYTIRIVVVGTRPRGRAHREATTPTAPGRTPRRGRGQAARRSSLSSSAVRKYNCLSTSLQHAAFAWALRWRIRMAACIIMLKLGRVTRRRPRRPERPAPATLGPAPAGPPGCPPGSDSNLCSGRYG